MILWADIETASPVPISSGTWAYAEKARVLMFAWAIDDGPVRCWDMTAPGPMPASLTAALADEACTVVFHNGAMFDLVLLEHAAGIHVPLERLHDTMVQALSHSLPAGLAALCDVLKVPVDKAKDKAGRQLIRLFCSPRPDGSWATRETHPAEWARFLEYARLDVEAMRECYRRMPTWNLNAREREVFLLDQRINRRGIAVDVELARTAVAAVDAEQARLHERTRELTLAMVDTATQRDAMLAHILAEYGVALPDLQAATLERRIADPDLPAGLRELLAVRLAASTTSTAKYKALLKSVSSDGRLRGTKQFRGAGRTGRWSGRIVQPDNLPRQTLPQATIEADIKAFKAGVADVACDDVMASASNAIRGAIVAPRGMKLVIADLANIEGRVLAWIAGERWKLQAFGDYDAGTGHDLYKLAYARSFAIAPEDVTKEQRAVGKVMELGLGYQGSVGAFITFAAVYGINLEDLADRALPSIAADVLVEARGGWDWARKSKRTYGLSERAYIACDAIKRLWRAAHPGVVGMWSALEQAAVRATLNEGVTCKAGPLAARRDGNWLRVRLPSGNYLCYPSPRVDDSGQVSFVGTDQYTKKWDRLKTYGGRLVENACQSIARDVLAAWLLRAEVGGFTPVMHVHDEIVAEVPDTDEYSVEGLIALLPDDEWMRGLPLAAEGFESMRYRK